MQKLKNYDEATNDLFCSIETIKAPKMRLDKSHNLKPSTN